MTMIMTMTRMTKPACDPRHAKDRDIIIEDQSPFLALRRLFFSFHFVFHDLAVEVGPTLTLLFLRHN